ncbi:MAG: diguanylate cyclase [Campylobacterota bacterium]|nr:diguanylate cyclase [Campylobacterota bacterium]
MKYSIIIVLLSISLNAQLKDVTLVLPWKHQFQFAGYYVAQKMGYYKDVGLHVKINEYDFSIDNTKDVSTLKSEFGVGHSSLIIDRIDNYKNIVLLNAIHQVSPFVLISTKYSKLEDIAGKTVMMTNDQASTASINAMLYSRGLQQSSYKTVDTSFTPQDLVNSKADFMTAYSSNEPYTLSQKGLPTFSFDPKDYGYEFYGDMLFTSKEMIETRQEDVDNFRLASLKGWKYAYEHIDETVDLILKYYNTQNRARSALLFEANVLKEMALVDNVAFGNINPLRLKEITTTYHLLNLIKKKNNSNIDFKSFIYATPNDFDFVIEKEEKSSLFLFIENIYFIFFTVLLFSIILVGIFFKIKMQKLLEKQTMELKLTGDMFHKNIASCKTDIKGRMTYVSEAFCKTCGYTESELLNRTHAILKSKESTKTFYKELWMTIASGHVWKGEFKNIKKDGSAYWIQAVITPLLDKNNNIISYEAIAQDTTLSHVLGQFNVQLELEVKKKTEILEKLAVTDKLTGIYNRVKLDDELESNYKHFQEFNENFSIIIIDIDKFKDVNDTHGHQVGDIVLKEVTQIVKSKIRSTDTLGRWGGEEFMVICPNSNCNVAYDVAQKIRKSIEIYKFSRVGKLSISAGVADIHVNHNLDQMITCADTALYDVKHSGRNNVGKCELKA